MPVVHAFISQHSAIDVEELRIACEEIISEELHDNEGEGQLQPQDIIFLPVFVPKFGFDVLLEVSAFDYPERRRDIQARSENARALIEASIFKKAHTFAVTLKLDLSSWDSTPNPFPAQEELVMTPQDALHRAIRRIETIRDQAEHKRRHGNSQA